MSFRDPDYPIERLRREVERFVERAMRICGPDAPFYEPPPDKSHIWAELEATVSYARDTLEEVASR